MHDQLMAVIARPTCSLVVAVVCRFLRVRRTFNAETVVGMASGLRERLQYLLPRLVLPIANCAIGETVSHLAKRKQNYSPIWRNAFTTTLTRIVV